MDSVASFPAAHASIFALSDTGERLFHVSREANAHGLYPQYPTVVIKHSRELPRVG